MNRVERLHLNMPIDPQYAYRPSDARRDEAVNTVDSTFRRLKQFVLTFFLFITDVFFF